MVPGRALGFEQPASGALSLWGVPAYRSALPAACTVCQAVSVRTYFGGAGWPSDPVVDPDERGQAKPSESMPELSWGACSRALRATGGKQPPRA
jgi:hypothetical protein